MAQEGAAAASKNVDEGRGSGPASPDRLRHMHADVAELLLGNTTPRRRRTKKPLPAAVDEECGGQARYDCAFEEEDDGFVPPRLVWAKVKGHPWWPGQVFDQADASALALSWREGQRRRGVGTDTLVACFGDGSFVWTDAAGLHPFRHEFRHADNGKAAFMLALGDALAEVARRVDAGLSCGFCGGPARSRKQVFHNSGLRRGASGAAVDTDFTRDALRGEALVGYVRALAVAPGEGADKLDFTIAAAQLEAFNRWRSTARRGKTVAFAARASRAATPRRTTSRWQDGGDASAGGNLTMTRCARALAADAAFMRDVFGEASVEYASASAMELTPPAGAQRRDLVVARPLPRAFADWRAAPTFLLEHNVTNVNGAMDAGKKTRSPGGEDSVADPGKWRVTSCISSRENSSCDSEDDGHDDDDDSTESEYSDDGGDDGGKWGIGWKDYVIVVQFIAIVLLMCQLMM